VALYKEVQALAQQTGNRDRLNTALNNLGTVAQERGDLATAQAYYRQALELALEIGVQDSIVLYLGNIAYADAKLGNTEAALSGGREALRRALVLGTRPWVVMGLMPFIEMAHAQGDDDRALALMGMAQQHPAFSQDNRRLVEQSLKEWALDGERVQAGLARGAAMDFDSTVRGLIEAG
jgi:tetratricopeptide (TPR) repeat protein